MQKIKISIIGLGYVGLPLAVAFSKKYKVIGYDISKSRINDLLNLWDKNSDISLKNINKDNLSFTYNINDIKKSDFFIITLPTPVDQKNKPDLKMLISACKEIKKFIKKGSIVIFESTVYPGLIEEKLLPIICKNNRLKYNKDFYIGYSPERINPGDTLKKLENIVKITSGSSNYAKKKITKLYSSIIKAGIHEADSIKIAESAKVIENIQRDVNIALINNFYEIFTKLEIDFNKVMKAASTKWNFLNFKPGLVGGHCVGVDPYYLIDMCNSKKINSDVIQISRKFNENFINYLKKLLLSKLKNKYKDKKVLFLGATFKENCSDIRNSGSIKLYKTIKKDLKKVDLFDPNVIDNKLIISDIKKIKKNYYDLIALIVPHQTFKNLGKNKIKILGKKNCIFFDLKSFLFP